MRRDKGVAGLNLFLGVIIALFSIGFIVMVFSILGGELESEMRGDVSGTVNNETLTGPITEVILGNTTIYLEYYDTVCSIFEVTNASDGTAVEIVNFTAPNCQIRFNQAADEVWNNSDSLNFSFTWTGTANTTASGVALDTSDELAETTDWFGIIIVIGAMVVLILLTVVIINAIKGTGLIAGANAGVSKETA